MTTGLKTALGQGWRWKLGIKAANVDPRAKFDLPHRCPGCGRIRLICVERVRRHTDDEICIHARCGQCGWEGSAP